MSLFGNPAVDLFPVSGRKGQEGTFQVLWLKLPTFPLQYLFLGQLLNLLAGFQADQADLRAGRQQLFHFALGDAPAPHHHTLFVRKFHVHWIR